MLITPSFKKSLIVEQFQGNYLNMTDIPWPRGGRINRVPLYLFKRAFPRQIISVIILIIINSDSEIPIPVSVPVLDSVF